MLIAITLYGGDLTIEVKKKVQSLPTLAIEDASISYDDSFKMEFFKAIFADMNVLSQFNVDRKRILTYFKATEVDVSNKDKEYVLRYKLFEDDARKLNIEVKLIRNNEEIFLKKYKITQKRAFVFLSHAIAYDINALVGGDDISWIKRKVIFAKVVAPKKTEIVLADYTLHFTQTVLKGGFNIFPKWADKKQSGFYYSSVSGAKPTLKYFNLKTAKIETIASSDGMIVCSDVSDDGKKLLVTMAPSAQPDIYMYNTNKKSFKRLTTYGGIDVGGQFLGNDKIVFISDRLGYPNVFAKEIAGSSAEQLVDYGRTNSACSVFGNYVVYKARESSNIFSKNTFNLHLISLKSYYVRRLTATGINEYPRFSKDGDAVLFIKNYKNQSAIGVIRLAYNKNYLFPLTSGKIQAIDW